LLELRRRADAVGLYQRRGDAKDAANDAGEIKVRAERGLGQIDGKARPHGSNQWSAGRTALHEIDHATRTIWRQFGKLRDDAFDRFLVRARAEENGGITTAAIDALRRGGRHVTSTSDDWYTPRWLTEQLGLVFDIDVCAPVDHDARTVPAKRYYTIEKDGLTQPWDGLIWCNPPYSDPEPWIDRWATHGGGLLLTHVSAKSSRMAPLWRAAHAIVFFARMDFDRPDGGIESPFWMVQLAARGEQASQALNRVRDEWASPVLGPLP